MNKRSLYNPITPMKIHEAPSSYCMAYLILTILLTAGMLHAKTNNRIVSHPSKLTFDSLRWQVPLGTPYRHELKNGAIVYIARDSTLPLVEITAYVRYGSLTDPVGKAGLSTLYATMLRSGGTKKFPADTLEALLDLLALKMHFSASSSQLTFSASFLSEYRSNAFEIIREMFFHPSFNQKKLNKEKSIYSEKIKHRFDNPAPTCAMAYEKQMYSGQPSSRLATKKSLKNITRNDLIKLHKTVFSPANMIFCIAGSFNTDTMLITLEKLLDHPIPDTPPPVFPPVKNNNTVRALIVHKPITQAYVRLGLPLFQRPHPDYYAMTLLNEVLGGGGFTSHLAQSVRSDKGLTYSIASIVQSNYTYPGTFFISFFTKNKSFAQATALTIEEVKKIISDGVTVKELDHARSSLINELPSMFRSAEDIVSSYGWNEYYHRAPDHFKVYKKKLNAITCDDLKRVAHTYLKPDSLSITVVGDTTVLLNQSHNSFSLKKLKPHVITPKLIPSLP